MVMAVSPHLSARERDTAETVRLASNQLAANAVDGPVHALALVEAQAAGEADLSAAVGEDGTHFKILAREAKFARLQCLTTPGNVERVIAILEDRAAHHAENGDADAAADAKLIAQALRSGDWRPLAI